VFHKDYLSSAEQMLRNQDRSKSVFGISARISDDMGVTEINSKGCGWVDTGVHTCYCG
jgi:hypothetical protein